MTAASLVTSFAQLQALTSTTPARSIASDPGFANLEVLEDTNGDGSRRIG